MGWVCPVLCWSRFGIRDETGKRHGRKPFAWGTLVLLALVSWALYTIGSRRVMERVSPLTVNWTTLLISILFQIPLLWIDHKVIGAGVATIPLSGWIAGLCHRLCHRFGPTGVALWGIQNRSVTGWDFRQSYSRVGLAALGFDSW